MAALFAFFLSPVGRWLAGALVILVAFGGLYAKGRVDGRSSYKAKVERQINEAISKGDKGRADALRRLDDGGLPNGWFRD